MLEWNVTYADVLQGQCDKQRSVVFDDTSVEGELKVRHAQRRYRASFSIQQYRREASDSNA